MPDRNGEPLGNNDHASPRPEVQYILVGSLIGAILLLIVYALVTTTA